MLDDRPVEPDQNDAPKEDVTFLSIGDSSGSQVNISDEVIAAIAGTAALQVQGVSGVSGSIVGSLGGFLGRRNLSKGVRVSSGERDVVLDLYVSVKYGARIPEVAFKVQEGVKKAVEGMTELRVAQVNIHVQGVSFGEPGKPEGDH